ncbi:MAG TPA: YihY/virulence factor BrkB family protein [Rhizomicrobium sp.]|jgi:membrane protein
MIAGTWRIVKQGVLAFIEDDALSRGAAIAFYAVTGFLPALVILLTGMRALFGHEMIRAYLDRGLEILMGREGHVVLDLAAKAATGRTMGTRAEIVGTVVLLVTASGAFSEVQSALNVIWRTSAANLSLARFLRARIVSMALVLGLGALLLASMLATVLVAQWLTRTETASPILAALVNFVLALVLTAGVFAAIYKVLPDTQLEWGDVVVGAFGTAFLYELGQIVIGLYLYNTGSSVGYSVAGGFIVVLLWIYYSAQVFLLGAEFTKIYATRRGSRSS